MSVNVKMIADAIFKIFKPIVSIITHKMANDATVLVAILYFEFNNYDVLTRLGYNLLHPKRAERHFES